MIPEYWAPESDNEQIMLGKINTNWGSMGKWLCRDTVYKDKNIRDYVNNHVSTWPDGTDRIFMDCKE